jgi:rhodanese-related sulfurtransferase
LSAKTLKDMGLERVSHVESGFKGWKEDGMPVVDYATWKSAKPSKA